MNTLYIADIEHNYISPFNTKVDVVFVYSYDELQQDYELMIIDSHFVFDFNHWVYIIKLKDLTEFILLSTIYGINVTLSIQLANMQEFEDAKELVDVDDSFLLFRHKHTLTPDIELEELLENC